MKELQDFVNEVSAWAAQTFPASSHMALPKLHHLRKEVDELIYEMEHTGHAMEIFEAEMQDKKVREEFADCVILLLQAVDRYGMSMEDMLNEAKSKFRKAQSRKWGPPDEHGVIEHIRDIQIRPTEDGGLQVHFESNPEKTKSWIKEQFDNGAMSFITKEGTKLYGKTEGELKGVSIVGPEPGHDCDARPITNLYIPRSPEFFGVDSWEQLIEDGKPGFPEFPPPIPPAIQHEQTRVCASCGHELTLDCFETNEPRCILCDTPPPQQVQ